MRNWGSEGWTVISRIILPAGDRSRTQIRFITSRRQSLNTTSLVYKYLVGKDKPQTAGVINVCNTQSGERSLQRRDSLMQIHKKGKDRQEAWGHIQEKCWERMWEQGWWGLRREGGAATAWAGLWKPHRWLVLQTNKFSTRKRTGSQGEERKKKQVHSLQT